MNCDLAGEAGGRKADGGTRKGMTAEIGRAAPPASPPGALPERLRLPGGFRVFRVFRVFRGHSLNDYDCCWEIMMAS